MADKFLIPGTLPDPFEPPTWERVWAELANCKIVLSGETKYIVSASEPAASDRGNLWVKTDATGGVVRVYLYANGKWLARHPYDAAPLGRVLLMWTGDPTSLETYDGGSSGTVTATTGPMWEVASEFVAKSPIGVDAADTLGKSLTTVGDEAGSHEHVLTTPELPSHQHALPLVRRFDAEADLYGPRTPQDEASIGGADTDSMSVDATGDGLAHNNLGPVRAVYFIKRTGRIYYVG